MRPIAVRVVPHRERRLLGWIVGLAGGIGTYLTTMEPFEIHGPYLRYELIGLSLMAWNGGMLLAMRPAPFTTRAVVSEARVSIGAWSAARDGRADVSVARGARGFAVAASGDRGAILLEVETEADARALLGALRVPWPGKGTVELPVARARLRLLERSVAAVAALGGLAYLFFVGILENGNVKPIGLVGLLGFLPTLLYFLHPLLLARARIGEHATLPRVAFARSAVDRHIELHALRRIERDEAPPPPEAPPRVRVLVRGDETTEAWLSRIDGLGAGGEGYRGDAATREELYATLEDERTDDLARLGAARVLARRHGEPRPSIEARVPPDLAPRVRAVVAEDPSEAAADLDALGPTFRAGS